MTRLSPALIALLLLLAAAPAAADDAGTIRARLEQWMDDVNARRGDTVCDLYNRDAIVDFRGQPERTFDDICTVLKDSLDDPARSFHYELAITEILVGSELAAVRRTWTVFVTPLTVTSVEPGMDIFHRDADGAWRIIRSIAYAE